MNIIQNTGFSIFYTVAYLHTKGNGGLFTCILTETVVYLHTNGKGSLSTH